MHWYVHYLTSEKKNMASFLKEKEFAILPIPVFVGNQYVQPAGPELKGEHLQQYHTYVIPQGGNPKDAVALL